MCFLDLCFIFGSDFYLSTMLFNLPCDISFAQAKLRKAFIGYFNKRTIRISLNENFICLQRHCVIILTDLFFSLFILPISLLSGTFFLMAISLILSLKSAYRYNNELFNANQEMIIWPLKMKRLPCKPLAVVHVLLIIIIEKGFCAKSIHFEVVAKTYRIPVQ